MKIDTDTDTDTDTSKRGARGISEASASPA